MTIKSMIAKGVLVGALSFGALGLGTGVAEAAPAPSQPAAVSTDRHDPGGDRRGGQGDWRGGDRASNWRGGDDHRWDGQHPWGWGAPPPPAWNGPLPPPDGMPPAPFDYWGQTVTPAWDPGFNQWGFWFLGVWIPL